MKNKGECIMNKEGFIRAVEDIRNNKQDLCVAVTIPGQKDVEYIINKNKSIKNKLEYYKNTYNDKLEHCMNDRIKIVRVFGVDFYDGE